MNNLVWISWDESHNDNVNGTLSHHSTQQTRKDDGAAGLKQKRQALIWLWGQSELWHGPVLGKHSDINCLPPLTLPGHRDDTVERARVLFSLY